MTTKRHISQRHAIVAASFPQNHWNETYEALKGRHNHIPSQAQRSFGQHPGRCPPLKRGLGGFEDPNSHHPASVPAKTTFSDYATQFPKNSLQIYNRAFLSKFPGYLFAVFQIISNFAAKS